ncbi:MAG: tRNA pseudouridine(55) synthase TruB [Oscillospiraceae bacterium]|nr:tRNA pseudouridine(55) synthase TruB [Oscillospiraceae bacterium]
MTGILNLDKPAGWTSHDAVAKLRRILGERRIGHGGTLDPMATGVLPVFVGRATRAVEFLEAADKEYEAGLRLGIVTDTQDTTGQILEERPVSVTEEELRTAILALRGERDQLPPMYSAVKVGGKALYAYARAGKAVERKPRHITIHLSEPLGWAGEEYRFRIVCSKGTYIRTLCHDLGETLGCGGAMSSLRRLRAGPFRLEEAVSLETVMERGEACLLPLDSLFRDRPALTLDGEQARRVCCGNDIPAEGKAGQYRLYGPEGEFLALAVLDAGQAKIIKSFFEVRS